MSMNHVSCHYVSEFAGCFYPNIPVFLETSAIVNMLIYVARLVVFLVELEIKLFLLFQFV